MPAMGSNTSFSWASIVIVCCYLLSSFHGMLIKECSAEATLTLSNRCGYTVWPGILSNAGSALLANGGFRLDPGETATLEAPEGWSGRMWGRTGCSFPSGGGMAGGCETGDCAGRLQCSGAGAQTPATLAEFTFGQAGQPDFYDVSLVDGYNLPIAIVPVVAGTGTIGAAAASSSTHCAMAGCSANLNPICPAELRVLAARVSETSATSPDSAPADRVVGCKSACDAFGDPKYCCSGAYANPNTCSPSAYARMFKSACPAAYSYAFDDPTSTFTCASGTHYSIVYCPSSSGSQKSVAGMGQTNIVGTQAYASDVSASAPAMSAARPLVALVLLHVILLFRRTAPIRSR